MAELPFNWQLVRTNNKHQKKNCCISYLKINAEWSLVCLWSKYDPYQPEFLEIRRNSPGEEILVSGTFKLMRDGGCLLLKKFMQLIEAGFTSTQIVLDCDIDDYAYHGTRNYSLTGTLIIPLYDAHKEYVKGIQFSSLLDLSVDFKGLLNSNGEFFSDVNVNCGTISFAAHKNILCTRSPVFSAMFSTKLKENQRNQVDITDLSPQVLKTMLTYIYSGKNDKLLIQSAGELLFAVDKYQLLDLKRVCCDYLKSCTSAENVLRTLVLGELHDKDLKFFAMDFICNSCLEFEVLEKTEEWKNLREKRPSLAMDVLTDLVKSKNKELKKLQVIPRM